MKKAATIAVMAVLLTGLAQFIQAQESEIEIRRGEVMQVVGNTVIIRVEGEGVKRYTIPRDFRFNYEGSEITVSELREGMVLSGVRLQTTGTAADEDIDAAMSEIAEAPAAAAEDMAAELAETAETPTAAEVDAAAETESTEAVAAATAVDATTEDAAASSGEVAGLSPALIVGLALLVLIMIAFAVKGLGSAEGKKAHK